MPPELTPPEEAAHDPNVLAVWLLGLALAAIVWQAWFYNRKMDRMADAANDREDKLKAEFDAVIDRFRATISEQFKSMNEDVRKSIVTLEGFRNDIRNMRGGG